MYFCDKRTVPTTTTTTNAVLLFSPNVRQKVSKEAGACTAGCPCMHAMLRSIFSSRKTRDCSDAEHKIDLIKSRELPDQRNKSELDPCTPELE